MSAFDLTNYTLTPSAVPPLVVGVLIAAMGIVALIRERGTRVSVLFCLLTTSAAVWLLTFTAIYSTPHQSLALWWTNIEHLGVVFIPSTAYLFTLVAVDRFREFRAFAWGGVALSGLFYLGILSTDWFVTDMRRYSWGYYPQYGLLSIPFLVFFFGTTIVNLRLLWVESRRCADGVRKARLQGLLRAFCVGYVGSVDFLATYGIPVYPFGHIPVLGFVVLVARAIWRYRLVDITPAFAAEQIIRTLPDALFVLDWNGRVRIVNQTACRLFGKSESELMGSPVTAVSSALFKPDLIEALLQGDTPRSYEVTIRAPHDGVQALCVMASAMRDQDARPVAIVCIARDITERKQAEAMRVQLLDRIMGGQEEERRRIARELHDETGQSLASLLVGLRALRETRTLEEATAQAEELRQRVAQTLQEVQRLAHGLRPSVLDDIGLEAALQRCVEDFRHAHAIAAEFHAVGMDGSRLPTAVETALYRLAQEAMTNAARHAKAKNVHVLLHRHPSAIQMLVEDDGTGFQEKSQGTTETSSHLGLYGMRERVAMLQGSIAIESAPGQGTTIYVKIPLQEG